MTDKIPQGVDQHGAVALDIALALLDSLRARGLMPATAADELLESAMLAFTEAADGSASNVLVREKLTSMLSDEAQARAIARQP